MKEQEVVRAHWDRVHAVLVVANPFDPNRGTEPWRPAGGAWTPSRLARESLRPGCDGPRRRSSRS